MTKKELRTLKLEQHCANLTRLAYVVNSPATLLSKPNIDKKLSVALLKLERQN